MKKHNWGIEVWFNDMMMSVKHHTMMMSFFIFGQISLSILISYLMYGRIWGTWGRYVTSGLRDGDLEYKFALDALSTLLSKSIYIFIISSAVWFLYPVAIRKFTGKGEGLLEDKYVSGAKLITSKELNEAIKNDGEQTRIKIGNINYPVSAEPKHCLIIGRPGTGKTVCLSQIIEEVKHD